MDKKSLSEELFSQHLTSNKLNESKKKIVKEDIDLSQYVGQDKLVRVRGFDPYAYPTASMYVKILKETPSMYVVQAVPPLDCKTSEDAIAYAKKYTGEIRRVKKTNLVPSWTPVNFEIDLSESKKVVKESASYENRDMIYDLFNYIYEYGTSEDRDKAERIIEDYTNEEDHYADYISDEDLHEVIQRLSKISEVIDQGFINEFKETPVHTLDFRTREILKRIFKDKDLSGDYNYGRSNFGIDDSDIDYLDRIWDYFDRNESLDYMKELRRIYRTGQYYSPSRHEDYDTMHADDFELITELVKFLDLQKELLSGKVVI